jgi:hypothetical protein
MSDGQTVPQVSKKLYKNNTGGWLGVVTLDFSGKEGGVSMEPNGTIWLSDAEAILTSRAPRQPKDNPFEEQEFIGIDSNGARKMFKMRPLTLVSDDSRYVPSNGRYVPIFEQDGAVPAMAAARSAEPGPISTAAALRSAEIVAEAGPSAVPTQARPPATEAPGVVAPTEPPPTPPVATPPSPANQLGGEPPAISEPEPQSWVQEPVAPGQVLAGALSGSDEPAADLAAESAPPAPADHPMPAQAVPTAPGGNPDAPGPTPDAAFPTAPPPGELSPLSPEALAAIAEEQAAAVDPQVGEETGAAKPPASAPPEGEFAQAEEVGSPDAPEQG